MDPQSRNVCLPEPTSRCESLRVEPISDGLLKVPFNSEVEMEVVGPCGLHGNESNSLRKPKAKGKWLLSIGWGHEGVESSAMAIVGSFAFFFFLGCPWLCFNAVVRCSWFIASGIHGCVVGSQARGNRQRGTEGQRGRIRGSDREISNLRNIGVSFGS